MPVRATKRGADRTRLQRDCDVLVCGASFAGLAVARELAGTGARVLVIDRYEIGERQTSACAMPTLWMDALDVRSALRQTFDELVVHALGWRRVLSNETPIQPPKARLSRGLEVHPHGSSESMELWIDPRYVRAGYSWSFPAREELRVGVGSFWPEHHVKEPTVALAADLHLPAVRYQGNWIPHELRSAVEDEVFFVGDSAGHCLPLTAEGIRTALYFGVACGRELRASHAGRISRADALARYAAFSDGHSREFRWMLRAQQLAGRLTPSR